MSDNARILELCEQNGFLEQTVEDLKDDIEALETKVKLWRAEALAARETLQRVIPKIGSKIAWIEIEDWRRAIKATDEALNG